MKSNRSQVSGIVYSTESGRMCPVCGEAVSACTCSRKQALPKGDGTVRVGRSTKGRKGRDVTLITGLSLDPEAMKTLARELKQCCGSGGTIKGGTIEIQGDHRETLLEELRGLGYSVKRSGG
ncbi:MAG: translation initiation factor Sui1 [Pseudomonadota bacterium]